MQLVLQLKHDRANKSLKRNDVQSHPKTSRTTPYCTLSRKLPRISSRSVPLVKFNKYSSKVGVGVPNDAVATRLPVLQKTICTGEKREAPIRVGSHGHHVEEKVGEERLVIAGGKLEPQTWDSGVLSSAPGTKSTKVRACSRSLPMALRGNNDGRHMGDSPGARRELRTFLSFFSLSLSLLPPLCGPDFMA